MDWNRFDEPSSPPATNLAKTGKYQHLLPNTGQLTIS